MEASESKKAEWDYLYENMPIDNTVEAIKFLNSEIEKGNEAALEWKNASTQEGGIYDLSNAFMDLETSGALEAISKEIGELVDANGEIDVTKTRELVDSNEQLKFVMDEFNVSGYAMGKILTDLQNGTIELTDLNHGLIESYKILYSAMG
jgi:hypothetical protein